MEVRCIVSERKPRERGRRKRVTKPSVVMAQEVPPPRSSVVVPPRVVTLLFLLLVVMWWYRVSRRYRVKIWRVCVPLVV